VKSQFFFNWIEKITFWAKVSLNNFVCAVDGTTNEIDCFTNVDIVNLDHKRWISVHSNFDKVKYNKNLGLVQRACISSHNTK